MMNAEANPDRKHPTLFPYIKTGKSGIRIDFFNKVGPLDKKKPAFPFEILEHSDPLAHLVKARLVTDAGSEIEHLLILLQRDQVQPVKNISLPATNPAINQRWQQAFNHYSRNEAFDDCLILLGDQLADNGHLLPFQPLLYCSFKKQFFPPPCPLCGGLLDLCRDDDMLVSADLHSYSNSLGRYLFCPTCYQLAGETDFYTCLSTNQDEDNVKSYVKLISEYKRLTTSTNEIHLFPCRDCSEANDCHTPNGPVSIRISPFAFYPFHMFVFKAGSVKPADLVVFMMKTYAAPVEDNHPDQPVDILPIAEILQKIIAQWQMETAESREKPSLIKAAERPPRIPPREPSSKLATQAPVFNQNPDLQKTIIVPMNKNGLPADEKPDPSIDTDIPETMIIGAPEPTKPGKDHLNKKRVPSRPDEEDKLAQTIIVPVKKKG